MKTKDGTQPYVDAPASHDRKDVSTNATSDFANGMVDVLRFFSMIGSNKKSITKFVVVFFVLGIVVSFVLPVRYQSKTLVLPPQQDKSSLSSLGGLSALAGLGRVNLKSSDELYFALLKSEAVENQIIEKFSLQEKWHAKYLADVRKRLEHQVKFTSDKKSGLVTIEVTDTSAGFAAQVCNAYVEAFKTLLDHLAVTDAQQRRRFFEDQINATLTKISQAQLKFSQESQRTGVVSLDGQVQSAIRASAELRTRIASSEITLSTMKTYATDINPDVEKLRAEIAAMQVQLANLEQGTKSSGQKGGTDSASLANIRAFADLKYQEALLSPLRAQLEMAKIDQAKEGPLVQQIDLATPAEKKSSPQRSLIVIAFSAIGFFLGIFVCWIKEQTRVNPDLAEYWTSLKLTWKLR